jgi:RNA polymerase sigma factor (sigma-70 family)
MPTKTDRELLAAWRETGDESAFAELVARHRQMVFRTSLRMLGSVQDTEDAVQAVFVVLAQKAERLQREGSLGGWLHTVTRHVAMQALARRASHTRQEKEFAMWAETDIEASSSDVDTSAVLRCLDQELAGLSAVLRQAVVLRYLQGNSEKQAAELVGCPLGTLSWRASKGIAKLRQRLAKRGVALGGVALAGLLTSEASAAVPETLLPSILATVKTAAATTATATGATTTAAMLAKGAMKAMFIAKVKMVAAVAAAVVVTGTAVPVGIAASFSAGSSNHTVTNAPAAAVVRPEKAQKGIIDTLSLKSVPIEKALDTISEKGGIVIKKVDIPKDTPVTFEAKFISALDAIKIVTECANLTYTITDEGVVISDKAVKKAGTNDTFKPAVDVDAMAQRTYTISPLAATALVEKTGGGTDDEKIKQMFVSLGIAFPPGSTVTYQPASRKLVVRIPAEKWPAEKWEAIENCISQLFATSAPILPTKKKP